jgi:hypothetical protein
MAPPLGSQINSAQIQTSPGNAHPNIGVYPRFPESQPKIQFTVN